MLLQAPATSASATAFHIFKHSLTPRDTGTVDLYDPSTETVSRVRKLSKTAVM